MTKSFAKATLFSATFLTLFSLGGEASAQSNTSTSDTPEATSTQAPAENSASAIIVTGSRIRQPNLTSANPVAVISGDQIFDQGNTNLGDLLNNLPQFRNTVSLQNSNDSLGTSGLNLLDLRGLGTQRTLTLVNGRRHVGSDVLLNGVSVDVNTIPDELVQRVDILTGGASAVYGSDAIAGVVNFILKDNYDGFKIRTQTGVSRYSDAGRQFVSVTAGQNFADGRGNIVASLEFSHNDDYFGSQRPSILNQHGFVVTDTDPAGSPNGSDGVFDRTYYRDIRSATIGLGGSVAVFQDPTVAKCGKNVSPFTCSYQFQPDGSLVPQTGQRIGIGPNGSFLGGNGTDSREGDEFGLSPDLKRYSANIIGHFEISKAFVPFFEAKYVRTESVGSQSGPFFSQGTTLGDPGNRERVRLDNPFLNADARTLLTNEFLTTTVNPNTGAAFADTVDDDGNVTVTAAQKLAAQRAAIAAGTFRFSLRRNVFDFGVRDEALKRDTYRIVGGIRGDFNTDWHYEVAVNYGETKETNIIKGNVNVQRYLLALDTTRDANGNIVCRSKLNPAGTISYLTGDPLSDGDDPRLAGDIAACAPLNPFGQGSISQAAKDYILVDSMARGKITQLDISGYVSGDTSGFFNLQGGPIGFSAGGEYRRETLYYKLDDLTQEGYAFYNAIPTLNAPSFKVKEAYAELRAPIFKDKPFFNELSLLGNGRVANYKGATGTVYAYGGTAIWKPIHDITFRGTYARSVRAPNLSELYSAQTQNFAPGFADPCSARNIATGTKYRAANCAAAGIPSSYDYVYISSLETLSGGNPNLKAEKSDSFTGGVILEPRLIPGFSISADYFNIKVKGAIASVDAQDIADLCYDLPSTSNQYCPLIQRAGAGGGANGEIPGQILEGTLLASSLNYAKLKRTGVDVQINYNHRFRFAEIAFQAFWTHNFVDSDFRDPSDPNYADSNYDELNSPSDQVNVRSSIKFGKVTFGYNLRWIDGMYLNAYEDYNSLNGDPPQNADYAPIKKYPSVWYHDLRAAVDVTDRFTFYGGVDNVTNRLPPYGLTGVGDGSGIYDNVGRYMYVGATAKF